MISDGEGNVEKTKREEIVCCLHRFALVSQEGEGLIGRRDSRPKDLGVVPEAPSETDECQCSEPGQLGG